MAEPANRPPSGSPSGAIVTPKSKLLFHRPLDVPDELDRTWYSHFYHMREAIVDQDEAVAIGTLQAKAAERSIDVEVALLYGILTDTRAAQLYYGFLTSISKNFHRCLEQMNRLILEKYPKLLDKCRTQLLWLSREFINRRVEDFETVVISLLRQIVGGDVTNKNIWLINTLLDILELHYEWLVTKSELIPFVFYTFTRMAIDHSKHPDLREKEAKICKRLMADKPQDVGQIGRDLVRILNETKDIASFSPLWKKLRSMPDPKSVEDMKSSTALTVSKLMSMSTPRKFLQSRLTRDMEEQLRFLMTYVQLGHQKRYQQWFAGRYLLSPENESLIPDLVRYICGVYHPSNQVLQSKVIPRWAVIGWLLKCCKRPENDPKIKLALFLDYLYFQKDGNVMNIEPAVLLMIQSLRNYPDMTLSLLQYLMFAVQNFAASPFNRSMMRKGVSLALKTLNKLGVVQSYSSLTNFPSLKKIPTLKDQMIKVLPDHFGPNATNYYKGGPPPGQGPVLNRSGSSSSPKSDDPTAGSHSPFRSMNNSPSRLGAMVSSSPIGSPSSFSSLYSPSHSPSSTVSYHTNSPLSPSHHAKDGSFLKSVEKKSPHNTGLNSVNMPPLPSPEMKARKRLGSDDGNAQVAPSRNNNNNDSNRGTPSPMGSPVKNSNSVAKRELMAGKTDTEPSTSNDTDTIMTEAEQEEPEMAIDASIPKLLHVFAKQLTDLKASSSKVEPLHAVMKAWKGYVITRNEPETTVSEALGKFILEMFKEEFVGPFHPDSSTSYMNVLFGELGSLDGQLLDHNKEECYFRNASIVLEAIKTTDATISSRFLLFSVREAQRNSHSKGLAVYSALANGQEKLLSDVIVKDILEFTWTIDESGLTSTALGIAQRSPSRVSRSAVPFACVYAIPAILTTLLVDLDCKRKLVKFLCENILPQDAVVVSSSNAVRGKSRMNLWLLVRDVHSKLGSNMLMESLEWDSYAQQCLWDLLILEGENKGNTEISSDVLAFVLPLLRHVMVNYDAKEELSDFGECIRGSMAILRDVPPMKETVQFALVELMPSKEVEQRGLKPVVLHLLLSWCRRYSAPFTTAVHEVLETSCSGKSNGLEGSGGSSDSTSTGIFSGLSNFQAFCMKENYDSRLAECTSIHQILRSRMQEVGESFEKNFSALSSLVLASGNGTPPSKSSRPPSDATDLSPNPRPQKKARADGSS